MKLFTTTWHQRLAGFYGPLDIKPWSDTEVDFCKYFWACVRGFFSVLGILFLSALVSISVGDFLAWLAYVIINSYIPPEVSALAVLIGLGLTTSLVTFGVIVTYIFKPISDSVKAKIHETPTAVKTFSFFGTWYHTVKNKVCVPVKIKATESFDD